MVDLHTLAFIPFNQLFYGYAVAIEAVGMIVAFMISSLGYKAYKLTNESKYKYFFYGFLFLGLNFLAHVILNLMLRFGFAQFFVEKKYTLYVAPLFGVYYFFLIAALLAYISFAILYSDVKKSKWVWLFYFWGFVVGAYSFRGDYILFNILAAAPLSFVMKFLNDKKQKQPRIFYTFLCLFLFHALVVLEPFNSIFYVVRYSVLLVGLVLLFVTFAQILYGRKKK